MCNHTDTTTTTTTAEQAEAQCRAAVEADPKSAENHRRLGVALLLRAAEAADGGNGDGEHSALLSESIACLRRALSLVLPPSSRPGARRALGLALLRAGDPAAAAELERACELRPRDARARADLARALKECGRLGAAAEAYRAAIRLRDDEAEGQAKEADGGVPPAPLHYRLAMVLRAMLSSPKHCRSAAQRRRLAREARRCLARQLADDPGHALAAFWLAALAPETAADGGNDDDGDDDDDGNAAAAEAAAAAAEAAAAGGCPQQMVAALFDKYAPSFDAHLVGELNYATPQRLAAALAGAAAAAAAAAAPGRAMPFRRVVDLGCGTGLMGPLLRPMMMMATTTDKDEGDGATTHLCGVDLSARMVDRARERGCYDALHVGELVAWLQGRRGGDGEGAFDALVAADVVVYLGDLLPMLEAAGAACSGAGALFAFSTEDADAGDDDNDDEGDDGGGCSDQREAKEGGGARRRGKKEAPPAAPGFVLRPTGRFAHGAAYIARAAAQSGWAVASLERRSPLRMNAGKRIWGNLVVLRRV